MALASATPWQLEIAARGYLLHQEEAARAYIVEQAEDPDAITQGEISDHLDDWEATLTPVATLAGLLTVDGAGSLLDADKLDGFQGSYYTGLISAVSDRVETLEISDLAHTYALADLEAKLNTGASFPVSPTDGDLCYRTDLAEWFYWDNGRSKWLGMALLEYQGTYLGSLTNNYEWLDSPSIPYSAGGGHLAPFDLCVVGGSAQVPVSSTATWQLRDDGTSVATVAVTAGTNATSNSLNSATIAAGSVLSIFVSGTATGGNACKFFLRRTAT